MATCLALGERVATALTTPAIGAGASAIRERYEPRAHTINNANPYQGITITEGHGKCPFIFEPLQNVQTSRSTYKVTSFIDFTPYLEYFQQFERYLEAFKASIKAFENYQYYRNSKNRPWLPLMKEQEKRADTIQFAIHNPYVTN